jgi:hypothetical protein
MAHAAIRQTTPDLIAPLTFVSVQFDCVQIGVVAQRGFDDRNGQHRFPCTGECQGGVESLQHFLDDGETRRDIVEVDDCLEPNFGWFPKHLNPY